MEQVGTSSLWVERYRPKVISDLIIPESVKVMFDKIVQTGELPNLLLAGGAGIGKTSSAYVLCNELNCDALYINASIETSIDTLRYKVMQFASTSSLMDNKKVVIMDESDRLSPQAADSLKGIIEQVEANCRFIFTTNNLHKIIPPLQSRCQLLSFNYPKSEHKAIIMQYFKRCQFVLKNEKVDFDKEALAEFIQKFFPDFRKILNELQRFTLSHGRIDKEIFKAGNDGQMNDLIQLVKDAKFNSIRKLCTEIDSDSFYTNFYKEIDTYLQDDIKKAEVIVLLGNYANKHILTIDKEINLVAFLVELIMTKPNWR